MKLTDWSVKGTKMSAIIVDKKEKQKQIVQAAVRVFSRKGFARSTISDIAEEAGIGKGTVYEYFESKKAVIHQTFNTFMQELTPDFEDLLQLDLPAQEKIIRMITGYSRILESKENQDLIGLIFDIWAEGIRSFDARQTLEIEMNQFYREYRCMIGTVIDQGIQNGEFRRDITAELAASIIIGFLDGILVQWILDKKGFPLQSALQASIKTILYGICRSEEKERIK